MAGHYRDEGFLGILKLERYEIASAHFTTRYARCPRNPQEFDILQSENVIIVLSGGDRSWDHIRYHRGVAALNVGYIERFASHDAARSSNVTKQPLKLG